MAEKLPIDKISYEDFRKFKTDYLDGRVLSDKVISKIEKLFAVGDYSTEKISCCEAHRHSYKCISFSNPATGIVIRLTNEIRRYQRKIDNIASLTK